jgi:hypothetical protein
MCGAAAPTEGHGITRLGKCCDGAGGGQGQARSMGPYTQGNTAPCCSMCNMMKGCHRRLGFLQICAHIATKQGLGAADYGLHPDAFRDNVSKRSRSSYLTDSKTHSLTNEQFGEITARPCHYCGKESEPPFHYNGLDRLDSTVRVYNAGSCVSCCGTCNVCKYRYTEEQFLAQVGRVAAFNNATPGQDEEGGGQDQAEDQDQG